MATREQVRELAGEDLDYAGAARRLGISPGLAYLIATGHPADGSDTASDRHNGHGGLLPSSQHLANPPHENPATGDTVKRWMAGRAGADAQMRSAAEQASLERDPVQESKDRDAIDVLGRDHLRVRSLIQLLSGTPSHKTGGTAADLARRKTLVEMITAKLTRHEAAEEELLWPAVRSALPDGDSVADTARQQEQEGSDTLAALGKLDPACDDFDEHVEQLIAQVRKHVAYETRVFGMLREAMSARQRQRLGKRLVAAIQRHEAGEQAES